MPTTVTPHDYHSETDTLSCTQFKVFCRSPREYQGMFLTGDIPKKKQTTSTILGTVGHKILLERHKLDDVVRAYPTSCFKSDGTSLNPKPAAEFRDKIFPAYAMKDEEIDNVVKMVAAVREHEFGQVLESPNLFEQRVDADVDGVRCRCRPDVHSVLNNRALIYDLKFTERIHPTDWWKTAKAFGYPVQDSFYSRVLESFYGVNEALFRFCAVETRSPFRVQYYAYTPDSRKTAREYHCKKLAEFAERQRSSHWADHWETDGVLGPWDLEPDNNDNEMVEWEG